MAENETLWNWGNHQKYHADLENYIGTKITEHSSDTVSHITEDERTAWNGKTTIEECAETFINPNLIINSNFKINQRGQTEYVGAVYGVDCWTGVYGAEKVTVLDEGIMLTAENNQGIRQIIENPERLTGKTLTLSSVGKVVGNYGGASVVCNDDLIGSLNYTNTDDIHIATFTVPTDVNSMYVSISGEGDVYCKHIKLEPGTVATPYVDPDEALEMIKCQRTLQFHTTGDIDPIDLRPTMRITPTVTQMEDGRWMYNAEL